MLAISPREKTFLREQPMAKDRNPRNRQTQRQSTILLAATKGKEQLLPFDCQAGNIIQGRAENEFRY